MKGMDKTLKFVIICLTVICCSKNNAVWESGTIFEEGTYEAKSIQIIVQENNNLVDFKVLDHHGNMLIQNPHTFSSLHRWALYLDKDESLWVLSSDIGHYIFKKDTTSGTYKYLQFDHYLKKDEVPEYMYNDLNSLVSFR